jgi:hypothetical protein
MEADFSLNLSSFDYGFFDASFLIPSPPAGDATNLSEIEGQDSSIPKSVRVIQNEALGQTGPHLQLLHDNLAQWQTEVTTQIDDDLAIIDMEIRKNTLQLERAGLMTQLYRAAAAPIIQGLTMAQAQNHEIAKNDDDIRTLELKREMNKLKRQAIDLQLRRHSLLKLKELKDSAREFGSLQTHTGDASFMDDVQVISWKLEQNNIDIADVDLEILLHRKNKQENAVMAEVEVSGDGMHGATYYAAWQDGVLTSIDMSPTGITTPTSRSSSPKSASSATSADIHQAEAHNQEPALATDDPSNFRGLPDSQAPVAPSFQPDTAAMVILPKIKKRAIPPGIPAHSYICWEAPKQANESETPNKKQRTAEEKANRDAVREIQACLRCRRLKITVSRFRVWKIATDCRLTSSAPERIPVHHVSDCWRIRGDSHEKPAVVWDLPLASESRFWKLISLQTVTSICC